MPRRITFLLLLFCLLIRSVSLVHAHDCGLNAHTFHSHVHALSSGKAFLHAAEQLETPEHDSDAVFVDEVPYPEREADAHPNCWWQSVADPLDRSDAARPLRRFVIGPPLHYPPCRPLYLRYRSILI